MRKLPRQARALATADATLDAPARILGERGWQGLTTSTVAQAVVPGPVGTRVRR